MWKALKRRWRELRSSRPGHRFQERYERSRRARSEKSALRRFAQPVAGLVILAAGIFFCIFPGPGLPLVVIGAALLSGESLVVAKTMDWLEIRIRKVLSWLRRTWRHPSHGQVRRSRASNGGRVRRLLRRLPILRALRDTPFQPAVAHALAAKPLRAKGLMKRRVGDSPAA